MQNKYSLVTGTLLSLLRRKHRKLGHDETHIPNANRHLLSAFKSKLHNICKYIISLTLAFL